MQKIKFIHVADLHLDSPFKGITTVSKELGKKLKESTFTAFHRVIEKAINEQVDFVIIAGDIFDLEDRSIRAQVRFKNELNRLIDANIGVFICFGNHDFVSNRKSDFHFNEQVVIFGPRPEQKKFHTQAGVDVYLYGFSYDTRHVVDRKIEQYEKGKEEGFHIGILHGQLESNKEHDTYAPFTIQELVDKEMDYWALGHIHKRQVLHMEPPIIYPGNIQGRHKNEQGAKGAYLVELHSKEVKLDFFETSDIIWETMEIDGSNCATIEQLMDCISQQKEKIRSHVSKMIHLKVSNVCSTLEISSEQLDELIFALNEEEELDELFVNIFEIEIERNWELSSMFTNSEFYQRLFQPLNNEDTKKNLIEYIQPKHAKRLGLQLEDFETIEKRADDRLKQFLSKGGVL